MDDALNSTHELKKVAAKAAATDTISREDAKKIQKTAENIEKAVTSGDHKAAADHANKIQDRVEEIISAKQPEVAENLQKIDDIKGNLENPKAKLFLISCFRQTSFASNTVRKENHARSDRRNDRC